MTVERNNSALADERPVGSAARALRVLLELFRSGPLTAQELVFRTGLPRTAVHRAIHVLIDEGYVRYRLGRRELCVVMERHPHLLRSLGTPPSLRFIIETVDDVCRSYRYQVDCALLAVDGNFQILESTSPERLQLQEEQMESDLFLAGLALFSKAEALSIVSSVLGSKYNGATPGGSEVWERYRSALSKGFIWDGLSQELTVPVLRAGAAGIVIRLWSRDELGETARTQYVESINQMNALQPQFFPYLTSSDENI